MKKIKNIFLLLALSFVCKEQIISTFYGLSLYRCENEEVICYIANGAKKSGIFCNFKGVTNGK